MDEPFFSVIVPAHNSAAYIERGLNSIAEQTFMDYELIVICDACTDNTAEIALRYTTDVYLTDFHQDGYARNAGIDIARGKWILFMDDDDWFLHEFAFDMLYKALQKTDADVLTFSFIWKHVGYAQNYPRMWIAVWNKCWNREFIGDTRFSSRYMVSDEDFHNAMIAKKPKIVNWDTPLYYYNYMREGSQTHREREKRKSHSVKGGNQ